MFRSKLAFLFGVVLAALCYFLFPSSAFAQGYTPTALYQVQQADGSLLEGEVFDLSQMTIDDFTPVDITDPVSRDQLSQISPHVDLSHIAPGNLVASQDYLTVRLLDTAFGLGEWSLADISARTGTDLGSIPLSAYGEAIGNLTLGELSASVPGFGSATASQNSIFTAAISSYETATGMSVGGYGSTDSVQEILNSSNPVVSDIQLRDRKSVV